MKVSIPFGKEFISAEIDKTRIDSILESSLDSYVPCKGEYELVREAMENPIGSPRLSELAKGKKNIVLIASDHTRPVPSKIIIPLMLEEIRKGNPDADITILIATGCHRKTTDGELENKFGPEIFRKEKIVVHDCTDEQNLCTIGTLPSGGVLRINKLAAESDLLVSEGFIEPHFFAGFSGGRKSVLPGISSRETVYWNHNSDFIKNPMSRMGILDGNPIHEDMIYAAKTAKLAFITNVVINSEHTVIGAFAGDPDKAHRQGADFVKQLCATKYKESDIVISSNNGYPLDQNIYQAVKGMCTAESVCKKGGVIIMVAACEDGHGGEQFLKTFASGKTPQTILSEIEDTPKEKTIPDQWQSQIFARVLCKCHIILVTKADQHLVESLQLHYSPNLEDALLKADKLLGNTSGRISVIPYGISTIPLN